MGCRNGLEIESPQCLDGLWNDLFIRTGEVETTHYGMERYAGKALELRPVRSATRSCSDWRHWRSASTIAASSP
jgi:hypothetical protein